MPNSLTQRSYNLTDADLCMFTSVLVNTMARDLTDLTPFGVTALKIDDLKSLGDAFEVFPSDDYMLGDVMIATETKNQKYDEVYATIKQMAARVEAKWGIGSGHYRKLSVSKLSQETDKSFLTVARGVHLAMTSFLTDLASFGLTQQMLDDFEALNEELEQAMDTQSDAIMARDNKKQERISKGNELYTQVSTYCNFGKTLYEKTDPAKYNDYIIYGTGGSGPLVPVTGLTFNPDTCIFSWDAQDNATSYYLEWSANGTDYTLVNSGAETSAYYQPPDGTTHYRCRARNSGGFGDYGDVLNVIYYSHLDAPANFTINVTGNDPYAVHLNWDAVPGAEWYNLYHSIVNTGEPAGEYSYYIQATTNSFIDPGLPGKRQYYYLKAANTRLVSDSSAIVYADIVPPP